MSSKARGGESTYYFAFGSNMNPARMHARAVGFIDYFRGDLENFELVFDKRSNAHPSVGHANIRYARGGRVEGVVYVLRRPSEIERLDPYERNTINYSRELFEIATPRGPHWAWTYVGNRAVLEEGLRPEREYVDHLLAAGELLSREYVERLESLAVHPPGRA